MFNIVKSLRLRKNAKTHIGDEVSIRKDKGARFAYKGIYAFLNEDYSASIDYFEKAMKYSTVTHNYAFCLDWMSQCYDELDNPAESLRCCVKIVQAEPSNVKYLFNLADMYTRRGLFEKAEFYYNRVLRYDSKNIIASFMIGTLFMGKGCYDEAQTQFQKTLDMDEKFTSAMAELSVIHAIKGDYSQMDSYYTKARDHKYDESERLKKRLDLIKKMQGLCYDS
jgi:tetratricopeptide (TPR) repeat protein